jgi:hypothetical protein
MPHRAAVGDPVRVRGPFAQSATEKHPAAFHDRSNYGTNSRTIVTRTCKSP